MRRLLVAGLALIVLGAAAGASSPGTRAHAAVVARGAPAATTALARARSAATVPMGSACFIEAGRECSLIPCVEFIRDAASALVQRVTAGLAAPAVRDAPRASCPRSGRSLGSSIVRSRPAQGAVRIQGSTAAAFGFGAALRALAHKLTARPPRGVR